eukprot:CAMPEP_0173464614 /NCGR_PEP_ID=MMETSP1357-20121228/70256_1 /TAXON_ID=77926 /ORGANISM="Hemiselmis rufescens, Strain PCC563" /LENGTH=420 /DNA_ID=CAMNT_0014432533 /DNA_START=42 /DNA_END=1301 /DNA_ORIENTATION=-
MPVPSRMGASLLISSLLALSTLTPPVSSFSSIIAARGPSAFSSPSLRGSFLPSSRQDRSPPLPTSPPSLLTMSASSPSSRRLFLASSSLAAASYILPPSPARAAGPGLQEVLDIYGYGPVVAPDAIQGLFALPALFGQKTRDRGSTVLERRPTPVKLPRTFLFRPFAVLLMRTCYNTADLLDFTPMDQFQKDFFLLRQDQWEIYITENDVKQGDLSDPKYFDFISAAQFATITQSMRNGKLIFEESTGAEGTKTIIQRGSDIPQSNELLPASLFTKAGTTIYDALLTNFTGPTFVHQPPQPSQGSDTASVVKGMQELYVVLNDLGYALNIDTSDGTAMDGTEYQTQQARLTRWRSLSPPSLPPAMTGSGTKMTVTMKAPCTLWGRQWLSLQGYIPTDHDVMIAMEYLKRSGRAATVSTRV